MPLRLIERVLPWLTASLTEDEAKNFLKNLQAGGTICCMAFLMKKRFSKLLATHNLARLLVFFFLCGLST